MFELIGHVDVVISGGDGDENENEIDIEQNVTLY